MRKNLFLTLALAFASFAGANAQNWSLTMSTADDLPGEKTVISGKRMYSYTSEKITPSNPLDAMRVTFIATQGGNKHDESDYPFVCLSELTIYAADGVTPIPYTATSNADQNTLGEADGGGLAALNDGDYTNYWHSAWQSNVGEAHHLELQFEEPVSEFYIHWASRPHNGGYDYYHNAPTLVGLTPKNVNFVPYSDWAFTVGAEITSMDALKDAQYFVMKSNVPVEYHKYVNNHESTDGAFGTKITKEPLEGPGKQYVKGGSQAKEAAPEYAIQLIPADENGGYYFYFVTEGKFLSIPAEGDGSWNGSNGVQNLTSKMSDAAIINIHPLDNGCFEFSYSFKNFKNNDVEDTMWMGATPSTGGSKNVNQERYNFYKNGNTQYPGPQNFCLGYAYIITFDWTLQEVSMNYPAKYATIPVRNAIKEAKSIYTFMDSVAVEVEGGKDAYDDFLSTLEEAEAKLAAGAYENIESVFKDVEALNNAMGIYVYSKIEWLCDVYLETFNEENYKLTPATNPIDGYYLEEAFKTYITENLKEPGTKLYEDAFYNPYAYINQMKTFINSVQTNIDAFLASKITYVTLPKVYTSENPHQTPLGTLVNNNRYDWEQFIALNEAVDGIRLTFLETNVGSAASDGKYKNYPMVALSGLEIIDNQGNTLGLTVANVATNSLETSQGSLENLFDNDPTTFYHSIWGNGTMSPETYVYLDVKFPEGMSLKNFTIKTIGRENKSLAPGTVCITRYGDEYDPAIFRENPYNVKGGTQITDASQLKDGGLYIISGNLRVKTKGATPRYYAGAAPYHTNIKAALNDPCVYMFKKTENGWNIISLANAQYWALNKTVNENTNEETGETTTSTSWSTGLTVYPSNAAEVKFVKSGNLDDTFVIYSEIEENKIGASWSWKNEKDESDVIEIAEGEVNANKFVFMDWDGSLAGRPCVSAIPGEFTYGFEAIEAHAKAEEMKMGDGYSAGDYLHFNKANGEGEWNIYEVAMDDAYYLWANGIPAVLDELGLIVGKDPGCISGDIAALETAIDEVEAVIENENKEGAQAAVEAFVENIALAQNVERVKVMDGYWYAIESAYAEYYKQQGKVKAIYATENGLAWMDAPDSYIANQEFVFQFQKYDGENDPDKHGVPEAEADNVFKIYNDVIGQKSGYGYAGTGTGTEQVAMSNKFGAAVYVVKPLEGNIYTIHAIGADPLHTAGHGSGGNSSGTIVYWTGGVGSTSSWVLRFVDDAERTSIEDLVVEGDEVVSVAYYTPAGAAIPAPVSGVNIVVTVYSNGVIETKKVLVK